MLRFIVLLLLGFSAYGITAQTISNPGFDSVYIGGIDRIHDWIPSTSSLFYAQGNTIQPLAADSCYEWNDPMMLGSVQLIYYPPMSGFGVKLTTTNFEKVDGQPFETFIVNGGRAVKTGADGYIDFARCGEPFPYRPTVMKGWYQFHDTILQTVDYGKCIVLLKKYNAQLNRSDTIAYSSDSLSVVGNWTEFQIPINYQSTEIPDSIVVLFLASTNPSEYAELWLDELSFDFQTNNENIQEELAYPIIYPNPNSGIINIRDGVDYSYYRLLDMEGKLLKEGRYSNKIEVPTTQPILLLQLIDQAGKSKSFRILQSN